jgi:class 3 adenylate cyclase
MAPAAKGFAARIERMGDPLAWNSPDKCLFVACIFLTFTLWYMAMFLYILYHPDVAPYVAPSFLPLAFRMQLATIVAWTVVVVACIALRRRRTGSTGLVVVTLALCVYELVYGSYFFGLYTSVFSGLTIIASWAVGLVLFPKRAIWFAFAVLAVCVLGITIAEQMGLLPYGPLFRDAPFHGGFLHPSWLLSMGGVTVLMMVSIGLVLHFVIDRWHDREAKLAVASEQIARANDVISRYVASQLAEQVRAGNYGTLDRHERRRLTLFFSDIEDFAATADMMEPEDLSALLNEYLSEMTSIAERHGATIDKFVGDAIMIFFGAPSATSDADHALRAVRMALEMQARLANLREKWLARGIEKPFRVRMGINTGQASIGNFGSQTRLEYTAIGRQVNLAARLQAQCEPGRILLSHATWVFVRDEIPCVPRGEISLKGFREPVKAYEVNDTPGASRPLS